MFIILYIHTKYQNFEFFIMLMERTYPVKRAQVYQKLLEKIIHLPKHFDE